MWTLQELTNLLAYKLRMKNEETLCIRIQSYAFCEQRPSKNTKFDYRCLL